MRLLLFSLTLSFDHLIMELKPPDISASFYESLDDLVKDANRFAATQGYAIVKCRTKVSKKGVLRKAVLICDHGKKHIEEN